MGSILDRLVAFSQVHKRCGWLDRWCRRHSASSTLVLKYDSACSCTCSPCNASRTWASGDGPALMSRLSDHSRRPSAALCVHKRPPHGLPCPVERSLPPFPATLGFSSLLNS